MTRGLIKGFVRKNIHLKNHHIVWIKEPVHAVIPSVAFSPILLRQSAERRQMGLGDPRTERLENGGRRSDDTPLCSICPLWLILLLLLLWLGMFPLCVM